MDRKNARFKIKLKFHNASKKKASNASKITNKMDSSRPVINAKILPRVHVSLTRLLPTKMPDIAKQQYYALINSSCLINVIPDEKTIWDALSPETTPERENRKTSRSADLLSPCTRTQLQLSPVDLDTSYGDLSNEPWSDNSEPYPSPRSIDKDGNSDSRGWAESPTINKPCWSFQDEQVVGLLSGNPLVTCDNEVEAIMARQNSEVPLYVSTMPLQRPHPRKTLLQNIAIPLQPVDVMLNNKLTSPVTVCREYSPVFGRNGIWTTPGTKASKEDKYVEIEAKEKLGGTRKRKRHCSFNGTFSPSNAMDLENSDVIFNSLTPQNSKQERAKNIELEEASRERGSKLQVTETSVNKERVRRKVGRPRKRIRLPSKSRSLCNSVDLNSLNHGVKNSSPISFPETEQDSVREEVSPERKKPERKIVVSVETARSDKSAMQYSADATEQEYPEGNAEKKKYRPYSQKEHASSLTSQKSKQERAKNIELEGASRERGSKLQVTETSVNKERVRRKKGRPRKRKRLPSKTRSLCNSVDLNSLNCAVKNSSPISFPETEQDSVRKEVSTEREKTEGEIVVSVETARSDRSTMQYSADATEQEYPEGNAEKKEYRLYSQEEHSPQEPGERSNETPPVVIIDSSSSDDSDCMVLDSTCELARERVDLENKQLSETIMATPKVNKWLSAVEIEVSPLIKTHEMNEGWHAKSLPNTTVFLREKRVESCLFSKPERTNSHDLSLDKARMYSVGQEFSQTKENLNTNIDISDSKYRKQKSSAETAASIGTPINGVSSSSEGKEESRYGVSPENIKTNIPRLRRLSVVCEPLPITIDLERNHICNDSSISNESVYIEDEADEVADHREVSGRFSSSISGCQEDDYSRWLRDRGSPTFSSNENEAILDREDQPYELLEGEIELAPCSPIQLSKSPLLCDNNINRNASSSSDERVLNTAATLCTVIEKSNKSKPKLDRLELPKESSDDQNEDLPVNLLDMKDCPILYPKTSPTSLLDGEVCLTPCSPEHLPQPALWKQIEERRTSTASSVASPRCRSSLDMVSAANHFNSPVPLKYLVVKFESSDDQNEDLPVNLLDMKDSPILYPQTSPTNLIDGEVRLTPCSPEDLPQPALWKRIEERRTSTASSVASPRCRSSLDMVSSANHVNSPVPLKDLVVKFESSDDQNEDLPVNLLDMKDSPISYPQTSPTNLIDGEVRLTRRSPEDLPQPALWKRIEERRTSTASSVASPRCRSSLDMVSSANHVNSPVPLKDLVVKCDRLVADNYTLLKSLETVQVVQPQKPKRIRKKTIKVKDGEMVADNKKTNQKRARKRKRKTKIDSEKKQKPKKKRRPSVPDHYKSYKPSQLSTISHTDMRYRVAFTFWPQKFSGALDKINQRLINQNSFWKSLD